MNGMYGDAGFFVVREIKKRGCQRFFLSDE
jgi:hypothetical protein